MANSLLICRIESLHTGHGPYTDPISEVDELLDKHGLYRSTELGMDPDRHPGPSEDIDEDWWDVLSCTSDEIRFGFESLTSLEAWFTLPFIVEIRKHDFVIAVYSVKKGHYKKGKRQVMFDKNHAERLYHA